MGLRVALISDLFPPAICGVGDHTRRLADGLAAVGVEVCVVTTKLERAADVTDDEGVRIHRVAQTWGIRDLGPILRVIDGLGPRAIVHIQYPSRTGYHRRLMINWLPLMLRIALPTTRVVVTLHEFHERSQLWRARVAPMLAINHGLVFVRQIDRDAAARRFVTRAGNAVVIPIASTIPVTPVNQDALRDLRERLGFPRDQHVVVFFGSVYPDKGVLMLVEAINRLRTNGANVGLLVIGDVGSPQSAAVATTREVADYHQQVWSRMGQMIDEGAARIARDPTPEGVSELLAVGDLAVFPFLRGASENRSSLLAATEHGLPVLTTRGPSTPEAFEEMFGVQTVPAGDVDALTERMSLLLSSHEARMALKRGSMAASARWSWTHTVRETLEFYGRVREERSI